MNILLPHLTVRDISLISVLTALCVGGSYALIGLPNIKVMDLIVFVTGFVFGISIGATTGALAWIVYGTINPFGFSFPVWLSTIIGEAVFGIVGGIIGRINYQTPEKTFNIFRFSLEVGLWGLILTLIYDLFTNLIFATVFKIRVVDAIVIGWLIPPWFGILHEVSNFALFFFAVYPLIKIIRTLRK